MSSKPKQTKNVWFDKGTDLKEKSKNYVLNQKSSNTAITMEKTAFAERSL